MGVYYFSGTGATVKKLKDEAVRLARSTTEESFRAVQTSLVYDRNDELISKLVGEKDVYYLSYDQIPLYVKKAFITTEDKKFYEHSGVDYKAILRAIKALIENGTPTEGASTITQQLARNMFLSYEKTWQRKVEEIFIAMELEKIYSKDKILEFYINNIYFANGHYGIQAASRGYFSKDVSQLNLSEIAFLCAIPNKPSMYDPIEHFDNTITRRDMVLRMMYEDGIINSTQYDEACNTQITLKMSDTEKRNYVETYTYNCATRALMEATGFKFQYEFDSTEKELEYDKDYAEAYSDCQKKLYTGGYRIFTSIDLEKQAKLQAQMDSALSYYTSTNEEGVYQLQGAAVCINNITGYVEAIVGGRTQEMVGYTLNRAYQSYRQPGSTIKPILVYTPMLERGYTPDTIVVDEPIEDGPVNADGYYAGEMTLRNAVAVSKNTVAWNTLKTLTPGVGLKYLFNMGFTHLAQSDYVLPIALGGFTYGVSAVEMAGAYSTLENDGAFREPTCIVKIIDSTGNLIWERKEEASQVYQVNAARMMVDMMKSVMAYGTGRGYALSSMPCAGKTGTTNDNKDSWFIGFTHYYTTATWVGYDMPQTLPGTVVNTPISIWKRYMEDIHQGLEPIDLQEPLYN
ncbi:MAG: PBP1A family penicillin-binding protein [Lachnospiraceae bacterium]|nr:PBP1A family penicillin-binding protein [Lachnospiraceae bacterium]